MKQETMGQQLHSLTISKSFSISLLLHFQKALLSGAGLGLPKLSWKRGRLSCDIAVSTSA